MDLIEQDKLYGKHRGGLRRFFEHKCPDGQTRRVQPVYFRGLVQSTGRRGFIRRDWWCPKCGYSASWRE